MTNKRFKISQIHFTFNNIYYSVSFLVFVVFVCVTMWGKGGLLELMALKDTKNNVVQTNHYLLKENLLFLKEIQELRNSKYIEQRARTDLGLVKPNEVVFIVK